MLRITTITSADAARSYYRHADYYLDEAQGQGVWGGRGAERLGLAGAIDFAHFDRLIENRHPRTTQPLTVATREHRRVGYDFTFSVPKSLSVLHALEGDERIGEAFRAAVDDTMRFLEQEMQTRVRRLGKEEDRITGNMLWGTFTHRLSRPVEGIPDPQLHAHVVALNATFDSVEERWKAGQFGGLKADAPFFQAYFRQRLAEEVQALGYSITAKRGDFEVSGISEATVKKFSRRTAKIEEAARMLGIQIDVVKDKLGKTTREAKRDDLTWNELLDDWRERLTEEERGTLMEAHRASLAGPVVRESEAASAFDWALRHVSERESVFRERKLLTEALRKGLGQASYQDLERELQRDDLIRRVHAGDRYVTTRAILAEERLLIGLARQDRGRLAPLAPHADPHHWSHLDEGQRRAVERIVFGRDRFALIRGVAGAGKTTLLQTALGELRRAGVPVTVLAPSAAASRIVLRESGISEADTLQRFLVDRRFQDQARNGLIILDEASLAGMTDTLRLVHQARSLGARLLFLGDRRQHKSVARGDTLALLEDWAGIASVEVSDIKRQRGEYRQAVKELSRGEPTLAFDRLSRLGWIKEADHAQLAAEYVATLQNGKSALIVSPTHAEGAAITALVRKRLDESGTLRGEGRRYLRLIDLQTTEAERSDPQTYGEGVIAQFERRTRGHEAGERVIANAAQAKELTERSKAIRLFREDAIEFRAGDTIRLTHGGKTRDGKHRVENGSTFRVDGFTAEGDVRLHNGWILDRDYGHWTHGYVSTSHAAQGRTVDVVFLGQGAASRAASDQSQFYVSVSRGRSEARIFTDDVDALRRAVERERPRPSAIELARGRAPQPRRRRAIDLWRRARRLLNWGMEPEPSYERQSASPAR